MDKQALAADGYIGRSPSARAVRAQVAAFGATNATVIITAASGTGKELVARAIHDASPRCNGPYVTVDCGAMNDNLMESELYGHLRGSFSGAAASRSGLLAEAHGGTVFLDEIGDASAALQSRLLRVLEARTIREVGSNVARSLDIRVVAATNRDLEAAVAAGRFRADLLWRLDVLRLHLPSLRELADDIPEIARHLLGSIGARVGLAFELTDEAEHELRTRDWPGNVRQLRSSLEHGAAVARGPIIRAEHLPPRERIAGSTTALVVTWERWIADKERAYLLERLSANRWNRTRTAKELGLSRQTLHDKINRHRLWPRLVSPEVADSQASEPQHERVGATA